jgi:trk system potassium uptake protein TrkA
MDTIIMGCGRVGSGLAARLEAEGHGVVVIDKNPKARYMLPRAFGGRFLAGVGFHRRVLEEAGIATAEAFIAVTNGDNSNIVAARTAREVYRVPKVVARIYDPRRADIYRDLGITTVASVRWTVQQIHQLLFHRDLEPERTFGNGETLLVRFGVPGYLAGRLARELNVEGEIQVVEVTRGGRSIIPSPASPLQAEDLLTFVVTAESLGRLQGFLGKEFGR